MDWYQKLIAEKYDSTGPGQKKRGRRVFDEETIALVVKIGNDNPNWGYQRIANYIKYLGHKISFMTIKRILTDHGIYPPEDGRKNSDWGKFFNAHKDVLAACDFATYELLTPNGLVRESILASFLPAVCLYHLILTFSGRPEKSDFDSRMGGQSVLV